jgi:hypothetical protein
LFGSLSIRWEWKLIFIGREDKMNEMKDCRYRRVVIALVVLAVAGAGGNILQYLFWTGRSRADSGRFAAEQRGLEAAIADIERQRRIDGE